MNLLSHKRCIIGEGPIWNAKDGKLYHVNGFGAKEICALSLNAQTLEVRELPFGVAAMGFSKTGKMLISCKDGAFYLEKSGERTPLYDTDRYPIRLGNDAKVGPDGRFYVGTQSGKRAGLDDRVDGRLYSIDPDGEVKVLLDGMLLSNGFDWSMDERFFYHTDSAANTIREYRFDKEKPALEYTGREVFVPGVDGFTIDERDQLYVACWGRGYIAVVDTREMQIKRYIKVPATIPASCCFAGEKMDKLVVVTAAYGTDTEKDPLAGCTFVLDTDTHGREPYLFG